MKLDNINVISKNVLSSEDIDEIYKKVEKTYNRYIVEKSGQKVSDFKMPQHIAEKIIKVCEEIFDKTGLELKAYQFARYEKFTKPDGSISIPSLMPHKDFFPEPRYTFDYQLKSNTLWPIVIEGKEFILSDNEAITFSGTHQVHWRPKKDWVEGQFVDMLFCHLHHPDDEQVTLEHSELMKKRAESYKKTVGEW